MGEFSEGYIIKALKEKENFSFSRWGDGEWAAILGDEGKNTDQHKYYPDMGKRLKEILLFQPEYYLGLQSLAQKLKGDNPEFRSLVKLNHWVANEPLHRMSINGNLGEFVKALDDRRVILVGNAYLAKLNIHDTHIVISELNCWLEYYKVKEAIKTSIRKDTVVLYCASMMSNVLIDDLAHEHITQIDCGSVFDPYVGRNTRKYHKSIPCRELK